MSERKSFRLPDLGEGLTEADLVFWRVAVGDVVALNQVIADVESEKAVVELPSPYAGTVVALLAEAGDTVAVGQPIIEIDTAGTEGETTEMATRKDATTSDDEKVEVLVGYGPSASATTRRHRRNRSGAGTSPSVEAPARPLAKPPIRYMARVNGVDLSDVVGTGPGGVITREDVASHVADPVSVPGHADRHRETRTPVKGVRKHTAEAMVQSAFSAPHVTVFVTVDVTPTMDLLTTWRESSAFEGARLTPLAVIAKAVVLALEENPALNASWDEKRQEIVTKHYVNLGIAVATPRGLVVPNIKEAQRLRMRDLAVALQDLATAGREGKSSPADLRDGTFTITNIGVFGVDGGTPIINPGEAAILCVGQVRRQPWEFRGEVALRDVCTLSLSFDHRMVDGQEGSVFLASVARMLSDPTYLIALS